ncbi:MAG: hypothetical protein ABI481_12195 [Pyrinomonadaceae bacterium]
MKRCPKCDAKYADETLNFCLEDGEWLGNDAGEHRRPSVSKSQRRRRYRLPVGRTRRIAHLSTQAIAGTEG